jgi:hypothetical protein
MGQIRTTKKVAGMVVVVLAIGVLMAACSSTPKAAAAKPNCGSGSPKLTVQGTGLATGTPNMLTVSVGVDVTGPTAAAALADDNTKATAVKAAMGLGGIKAKDVQTSNLSINPQYNIKGVITGYEVSNTLTAKLRDFTTAGSVIDGIAGAAGNAIRLDSLDFSVEDSRGLEDHARNDAVHQAVSHAKSMALAAGERLGPVCSLTDQTQTENFNEQFAAPGLSAGTDKVASSVPLSPGSQQETAQVTIKYALLSPAPKK